ncbi:MAG: hypothetical protein QOD01_584, partial [Actinomycetota bacterium]|nr:hypothetical protein [Actinomycetota bacterium]
MVPNRPSSEEAFTEFEQCSVPGSKEGVPMNLLQAQLGHATLATTD